MQLTRGEQDKQEHSARTTGSPTHKMALPPCLSRLLVHAQARLLRWDPWGPGEFSPQTQWGQSRVKEPHVYCPGWRFTDSELLLKACNSAA